MVTEQEFTAMQTRVDRGMGRPERDNGTPVKSSSRTGSSPVAASNSYKGYRSKLELNWANYLDVLKAVKDIDGWAYEPLRFKLPGEKNYYKIDFSAWKNGGVTFYELKGWNQSDSRSLVKLKTAAGLNPWAKFVLVKNRDGIWDERLIA